ncbi:hypothetical protein CRE_18173 [Caenorhabditis remanei]|uniref:Uncharacterized protein n=1 Tax=Caenorhabditis remanei TaxID=31234 RepID=E3N8J2_CAERE|nr:hypothetical protein CRE_18173 [Caenorhabditis remanei]
MIRSTPAGMPPARGTKTLAWFMDNDILKNGGGENGENGQGRRGSSSDGFTQKSLFRSSFSFPRFSKFGEEKGFFWIFWNFQFSLRKFQFLSNFSIFFFSFSFFFFLPRIFKIWGKKKVFFWIFWNFQFSLRKFQFLSNFSIFFCIFNLLRILVFPRFLEFGFLIQNRHVIWRQLLHPTRSTTKFRKTLSGHGAARKEGFTSSQAMSESSEDGAPPPPVTSGGGTSSGAPTAASGAEEYWFYDVATDGYYYEQNGAKGWRRRQPNAAVHKGGKDQEVAHMSVNGPGKYNQLLAAQAAAAQAAFLQHAFQLQQSQMIPQTPPPSGASGAPQMNNPTMRYYDPSSDGFFYEMASVDGWKRRQPNKPVSASVPAGITRPYSQRHQAPESMPRHPQQPTSSYGAALARGQFPRNTVKQPDSEVLSTTPTTTTTSESARGDSTASSICGDSVTTTTFAELFNSADPMFNPIQRPSALKLEQKAVSPTSTMENAPMNSTAALFDAMLADLNGGEKKTPINFNTYTIPPPQSSQSPMKESWNSFRSCSLFSPIKPSKRVQNPLLVGSQNQQPMGVATPMIDDMVDDDTMKMLMRDLDKLWANTPVSTLNQA